jgi:phage pi2 protein 07
MAEKKDTRTRNWTFFVYPDSAPENWRDILNEMHMPWIESPLHDKDVDANGELKKAHWHILLLFGSKKSYEQVREITLRLKAPNPQKVMNLKGVVRYFAHMDDPDKFQYSKSEIIGHAGADPLIYLSASSGERYQLIKEMISFVKENEVDEIQDLIDYAMENRFDDWFPLLCDNSAFIMNNYIKSIRHRVRR